jgi:nucleoside phosphorylase
LKRRSISRGTVYDVGTFAAAAGVARVAVVQCRQGNVTAALEAERAIAHFGPKVLMFVGVAGAIKDAELGDVVVATEVLGYAVCRLPGERGAVQYPPPARHEDGSQVIGREAAPLCRGAGMGIPATKHLAHARRAASRDRECRPDN